MSPLRYGPAMVAAATAAILVIACTGGAASPSPAAGTTVAVALQEWSVNPAASSAPAGPVTFTVTNNGPEDIHELVVIKTDLGPLELPTDETGTVEEGGAGMTVIDEIEDIEVGDTQDLTVELDAGAYLLICNIYDEEEGEAHYRMGMVAPFTVNP
jgi:uncharacterized cupredoxin-like copper-binding protein